MWIPLTLQFPFTSQFLTPLHFSPTPQISVHPTSHNFFIHPTNFNPTSTLQFFSHTPQFFFSNHPYPVIHPLDYPTILSNHPAPRIFFTHHSPNIYSLNLVTLHPVPGWRGGTHIGRKYGNAPPQDPPFQPLRNTISFLTTNSILHPSQSGFRSGHSTNTALLDVSDFILNNMNEGRATAAIFLDLKKAFDTVNHDILISKLHCYGIKGSALNWFISYLTDRSQVVTINSHLSDSQNINIGVPQGSILGPLLFIIYVNSLPDSVTCKCIMYADDTTLLCSSSDPISLQSDLTSGLSSIANYLLISDEW